MNTSIFGDKLSLEQYPLWFIVGCILLGLLYASILYFKDKSYQNLSKKQMRWLPLLAFFRFLGVSTISFLLLAPLVKSKFTETVKPYIVLVNDASESIQSNFVGADSTSVIEQPLQALADALKDEFRVQTYHIGDGLGENFDFKFADKLTNLAAGLDDLSNIYSNQPVGAVILATDGIYNQGRNPIYNPSRVDAPLYAIALGDTTTKKDILIDNVLHNRIAYLNDKFTIRVDLLARNAKGTNTVINVSKEGNNLYSKTVPISNNNFVYSADVVLQALSPGVQKYTITAKAIEGEITTQNNTQEIYVEILDSRRKLLVLAASPHPDVAAIKQVLESNKNYELTVAYSKDFKGSTKAYDLVVLHGLPTSAYPVNNLLAELKQQTTPTLFILSSQTAIANFNNAQNIVSISGSNGATSTARAIAASNFNLFTFDNAFITAIEKMPPLVAAFGEYALAPTAQALLYQKIGSVGTNYPLLMMKQTGAHKIGVLAGEGLWRWRLYDYQQDKNHETISELLSKTIQYLAVKDDKRKFRVSQPKTVFNENEAIIFQAELYNDSYELINQPEVSLNIYDEQKKAYPFAFNRISNGYSLQAGLFPVGKYTYEAQTTYNGKTYTASGKFSVKNIQLEQLQTTANHSILYALTERWGGEVVSPNNISQIADKIKNDPNIVPIEYSNFRTQPLISFKWLFFVLLGLLSIEWFVRKFIGGY